MNQSKQPEILSVSLDNLETKENVRVHANDQALAELMVTMRKFGQLQPIGINPLPDGKLEVVWGNRRIQAARKLGWKAIDAVYVGTTDEKDILIINTIENIQRVDPSITEYGRIFRYLEDAGLSPGEISARVGKHPRFIIKAIKAYDEIPKKVQKKIQTSYGGSTKNGMIPPTTALRVLDTVKSHNLNKDQAEILYNYGTKEGVSSERMKIVSGLLKSGENLEDAIEKADSTRIIRLSIAIPLTSVTQLEKKYRTNIHDILSAFIMNHREFRALPLTDSGRAEKIIVRHEK